MGLDLPANQEDIQLAEVLRQQRAEFIQLSDTVDHSGEFYTAAQIGSMNLDTNSEYVRKIPENFNEESPNKFMYLILTHFALEGKDEAGKPNGKFVMDKESTRDAG